MYISNIWYQEEAPAQKKLEAEDIEKMSDSNQDIKNRLSEMVRDNAKQLLDPHRKVNGQPVPAQQPQLLTGGVMRWYQIEGIEWLRVSRALPTWDCGKWLIIDVFVGFLPVICKVHNPGSQ